MALILLAWLAAAAPEGDAGTSADTDTLEHNRSRLLRGYFEFLASSATPKPSNVTAACAAWRKLDPSSQAVFVTLTHRLQGSRLGADGSSMLSHVTKAYRIAGGEDAATHPPGSCGGGEYNRMVMSMDVALHSALVAANAHKGAAQPNAKPDLLDVPTHKGAFWRASHDLAGPHKPFDLSDETDPGAPRGQVQFFRDPKSALAGQPLARVGVSTLVDPYALEMDQDYDCVHASNPLCSYITYGVACFPGPSKQGTTLYAEHYGDAGTPWIPEGCP